MAIPAIDGFGHIDLTVTDGERSARWWEEVMGFRSVAVTERPGRKVWGLFHRSGLIVSVMTHAAPASTTFDERAVGLDHLALRVTDRAALQAWADHLDGLGVAHSGIQEQRADPLIVLRDPDNIQLELWASDPALV